MKFTDFCCGWFLATLVWILLFLIVAGFHVFCLGEPWEISSVIILVFYFLFAFIGGLISLIAIPIIQGVKRKSDNKK